MYLVNILTFVRIIHINDFTPSKIYDHINDRVGSFWFHVYLIAGLRLHVQRRSAGRQEWHPECSSQRLDNVK